MALEPAQNPVNNTAVTTSPWRPERLDLDGYLARLGLPARPPGRTALDELHERHVRTFTFDNIDVLLGQHPGVDLEAVQEKFVGRGRGGYCFEHSTILAAALEQLGYSVVRRLARVGDPARGPVAARTHLVVEVALDGERLLCDPGFGLSILRPISLTEGREEVQDGRRFRISRDADGELAAWQFARFRDGNWEVQHTTDELPVHPSDVEIGHHYTSTAPGSHFTTGLVVARQLADRHVTLTSTGVTIRREGWPTEHRDLGPGDRAGWLDALDPHLSPRETARLLTLLSRTAPSPHDAA